MFDTIPFSDDASVTSAEPVKLVAVPQSDVERAFLDARMIRQVWELELR